MSEHTPHSINYEGKQPVQLDGVLPASPVVSTDALKASGVLTGLKSKPHMSPAASSALTATILALTFVSVEKFAPLEYKFSYMLGSFEEVVEDKVSNAVNANEAKWRTKAEAYNKQAQNDYDLRIKKFEATTQIAVQNYTARNELIKAQYETIARMKLFVQQTMVQLKQATQSGDVGLVSMSRMFGRVVNLFSYGAGDSALTYADRIEAELTDEMRAVAEADVTEFERRSIDLIPPPEEYIKMLEEFRPAPPVPLPTWVDEPTIKVESEVTHATR